MLPRVRLTFTHETGSRCLVDLEQNGASVRVRYSLRSAVGVPVALAGVWLQQWADWGSYMRHSAVPPPPPPGWH